MPFLRKYLRVFKLLLNYLGPRPSFARELGLRWVRVHFMDFFSHSAFCWAQLCASQGGPGFRVRSSYRELVKFLLTWVLCRAVLCASISRVHLIHLPPSGLRWDQWARALWACGSWSAAGPAPLPEASDTGHCPSFRLRLVFPVSPLLCTSRKGAVGNLNSNLAVPSVYCISLERSLHL